MCTIDHSITAVHSHMSTWAQSTRAVTIPSTTIEYVFVEHQILCATCRSGYWLCFALAMWRRWQPPPPQLLSVWGPHRDFSMKLRSLRRHVRSSASFKLLGVVYRQQHVRKLYRNCNKIAIYNHTSNGSIDAHVAVKMTLCNMTFGAQEHSRFPLITLKITIVSRELTN